MTEQLTLDFDGTHYATEKESHYFDRKSARISPEATIKHIIAFANAGGGELVIGIENNGEITGFSLEGAHRIEDYEQVPIRYCEPAPMFTTRRIPVVNSSGSNDEILVIEVQPADNRVVRHREKRTVYLREGDNSVQLTPDQIHALEYDKGQTFYENEIEDRATIDDLDFEIVELYKDAIGADASIEQILRARGFMREGHLTRAGVLLFAKHPAFFYPCAQVRVIKYDGIRMQTGTRLNITMDRRFDGPIPRIIKDVQQLIPNLLREYQFLDEDGRFKIIPEYPQFAWFEGVVNAVTHRDYSFAGDYIRVSLYDDRMEIFSPGKLPNIVTLDNMRTRRYARNPLISRTLVELGWVREINEGVNRIYDEMQSFFLKDPIYSEPDNAAVLLTLENSATSRILRTQDTLTQQLTEEALNELTEYEYVAVQHLFAKGKMTPKELGKALGRSGRTASKTLQSLKDKGIAVWHGTGPTDPSQYYTLANSK